MRDMRVRPENITLGVEIGSGAFAVVYRAVLRTPDGGELNVAFKRINLEYLREQSDAACVERELHVRRESALPPPPCARARPPPSLSPPLLLPRAHPSFSARARALPARAP